VNPHAGELYYEIVGTSFKRIAAAASLCGLVLIGGCSEAGSWDQLRQSTRALSWGKRICLEVDNSLQAEALVDFPLLVTLNPARIDYDDLSADGRDLGFTTEAMEPLDFEIEEWNPGGTTRIWVRLPYAPGGGTARIWMYYSSLGQSPTQNPAGVWRNGYAAVWHLGESGGFAGCVIRDSTGNSCDGQGGYFSQSAPAGVPGWIGGGQQFGMTGMEGFGVPEAPSLDDLGPATWSFWLLSPDASESGDRLFSKDSIQIWTQSSNLLKIEVGFDPGPGLLKEYVNAWVSGSWQFLALSWDGGALHTGVRLFRNGAPIADSNRHSASGSRVSDAGAAATIGNGNWNAATKSLGRSPGGAVLDEVRVSRTTRSADWIRADYLSMTDALITYGIPETLP